MASPPSSQIPGLALPKKRPATTAISTTGLNPKRRKPSSAGPSNLRQTSFPPEGDPLSAAPLSALSPPTSAFGGAASRFSREASLESSSVLRGSGGRAAGTPSVVSGRSGRTGRKGVGAESKRKGRGKSEGTSSVGRPKSAAGAEEAEAEAPDDDDGDDDDEGGLDMEFDVNMIAAQAGDSQKDERDNVAMLLENLNREQNDRYITWRRVRLKKEHVRRLVNHTLSQSVTSNIVTAVSATTKLFIGDIIDRAREVQIEWQAASTRLPTGEELPEDAPLADRIQDCDRGPLTPDHLREALRRYKKERSGGSAGFLGLSLHGKDVVNAKMAGRRLFR